MTATTKTSDKFDTIAAEIRTAVNLPTLCDALNRFCADCNGYDLDPENELKSRGVDISDLPTYGPEEPGSTVGIFSWDDENFLVQGGEDSAFLIERRPA